MTPRTEKFKFPLEGSSVHNRLLHPILTPQKLSLYNPQRRHLPLLHFHFTSLLEAGFPAHLDGVTTSPRDAFDLYGLGDAVLLVGLEGAARLGGELEGVALWVGEQSGRRMKVR